VAIKQGTLFSDFLSSLPATPTTQQCANQTQVCGWLSTNMSLLRISEVFGQMYRPFASAALKVRQSTFGAWKRRQCPSSSSDLVRQATFSTVSYRRQTPQLHETLIQFQSVSNVVVLACNKLLQKLQRRRARETIVTKFRNYASGGRESSARMVSHLSMAPERPVTEQLTHNHLYSPHK
jgi:hypothetical protein